MENTKTIKAEDRNAWVFGFTPKLKFGTVASP